MHHLLHDYGDDATCRRKSGGALRALLLNSVYIVAVPSITPGHTLVIRWLFFATLSLVLLLQLRGFDDTLRTDETPRGIVGYELAWSAARADSMLVVWKRVDALETAKVSLGVDFAFLLVYPFFFATSIGLLRRNRPSSRLTDIGAVLERAVLLCIPFDAIENLALWRMIDHGASEPMAHIATMVSTLKFTLVIAAAIWLLAALGQRIGSRRTQA